MEDFTIAAGSCAANLSISSAILPPVLVGPHQHP